MRVPSQCSGSVKYESNVVYVKKKSQMLETYRYVAHGLATLGKERPCRHARIIATTANVAARTHKSRDAA